MTLFYDDEVAEARQLAEVVDLFGGPGGWDEAAVVLGLSAIGLEFERWACATRRAAGHPTVECDVSQVDPLDFLGAVGLIASPPCQSFSAAGNRGALGHIASLLDAIRERRWDFRPSKDARVWLVLEVGRWYEALRPEWVALEQVPAVLPLWEAYAEVLADDGYSVWTGILNAADFGVPQTRRRAVLIASRTRTVSPPPATHAEKGAGGLAPWVTMAEALQLGERFSVGFPRLDDRGDSEDGYRERDWRHEDEPSFTVTEKARSWTVRTGINPDDERDTDRPAPTATTRLDQWELNTGRGRSENAIRITVQDALVLQSFRADYPVKGTKTRQFEQIGNAIPPLLARRVLEAVLPSRVRQDHT